MNNGRKVQIKNGGNIANYISDGSYYVMLYPDTWELYTSYGKLLSQGKITSKSDSDYVFSQETEKFSGIWDDENTYMKRAIDDDDYLPNFGSSGFDSNDDGFSGGFGGGDFGGGGASGDW